MGHVPYVSSIGIEISKPAILEAEEKIEWVPYTGRGTPVDPSLAQPSNVRSIYRALCEVSEIIHRSLYILYSSGRPISSTDIINIYTEYLSWYSKLPATLRLGGNSTPHMVYTQLVPPCAFTNSLSSLISSF